MNKISIAISVVVLLMYGCSDKPKEQENTLSTEKEQSSNKQVAENAPQNIYGASSVEKEVVKTPTEDDMKLNVHNADVIETMNSGGYTYAKVNEAGNIYWIAGPQTDVVVVGSPISFIEQMVMTDFNSKSLNRKFDKIVFVSTIVSSNKPTQNSAHKNFKHEKEVVVEAVSKPVNISKNADGYNVEELYAKKVDLNSKSIKLNATVVKVSKNIMGKDWIHLQDGSGVAGTNDIIATSKNSTVKVGDIITASGIIKTDVDLGYGYKFSVMIEEAKFTSL
ncbi:hypothetical protein [Sulfurimonas sp. CS5]|uniref:hypothetical protein n=1 Tax=Sulfurimonas sp. CS5 TaxID=3391145 RepID=UPI0039ECB8AA